MAERGDECVEKVAEVAEFLHEHFGNQYVGPTAYEDDARELLALIEEQSND